MFQRTSIAMAVSAIFLASSGVAAVAAEPASVSARAVAVTAQAPAQLRIAGQSKEALVDSTKPIFSWAVQDSGRSQAQTSYQIRVAEVPTDTGQARSDVWDSTRVDSARSAGISYGGPALKADRTYEWSVRTWNSNEQQSPWSVPERFDVGLLTVNDWKTAWLQVKDGALARSVFSLPQSVTRARLYVGAQGLAEPFLNGAAVDPDRYFDSSATDFTKRVVYRSLDVTKQLHMGSNVLGVRVSKGSFNGQPTFIAQLSVTFTDGSHGTFGTDGSWTTTQGPVTASDFYHGESYDARKQMTGWDTESFDAMAWTKVRVFADVAQPQSLGQGQPVTALDETACCGWSRAALVDGIDNSTAASQGYHSAVASSANSGKWVQVDLGASTNIRHVTLFPAHPTNDPAGDFPGIGFPMRYRVLVSDDPSFATSSIFTDRSGSDQPNPGPTAVKLDGDRTGRYVRVAADMLDCKGTSCTFRLAELGIYGATPTNTFGYVTLEADTSPPSRVTKSIEPVKTTSVDSSTVYDFGQVYAGQVTLQATAPAGTMAVITKGEMLAADGHVSTANISFSPGEPTRQKDQYTFDGTGSQTWTPTLNYAGFRYAEVSGLPSGTSLKITARAINNDVQQTGTFTTSNPLLNKIQDAITRTQLNNLQQGMPLDCPTREKHGWMGDAGDSAVEAMSNFDMQSFYDKWLGDVRTSINPDGSLTSVSPVQGRANEFVTDPAWGSAYPQVVWESYLNYGDRTVLENNYLQVKNWVDYLGTISDENHIVVRSPGSWGDDWLSTVSTPHVFFQTGFYLLDSRLLAQMATALGKTDDATKYNQLTSSITTGFNSKYFDASTNVYGTGTQFSYAMPLALGIVPDGHTAQVADKLVADIVAHGNHLTTGFAGTTFVFQALGATGHNNVALDIAEKTDAPSFGYMVNQGPGTIWEKWNNSAVADGTSSKDHIGLGGSIGQWYYQQLAGIQPGTEGYRTFTLAPSVVGDLTHVAATQETIRGTISSSWTRAGKDLSYNAIIPAGATATIKLPATSPLAVTENGHPLSDAAGVQLKSSSGSQVVMEVGSGSYSFTVSSAGEALTAVIDKAGALVNQVAGFSAINDITKSAFRSLTEALNSITSDATAALQLLGKDQAEAAARVVRGLNSAAQVQETIESRDVAAAAAGALTPKVKDLVADLSSLVTTLSGLSLTIDPGATKSLLPGTQFDLAVTASNSGTKQIKDLAIKADLSTAWNVTISPNEEVKALAPGESETFHVKGTVPAAQLPGPVDVPVTVLFDTGHTVITSITPVGLGIVSAAVITGVVLEPNTVAPTSATVAKVTVSNPSNTPITGLVSISVPAGWVTPTDSPSISVNARGSAVVSLKVSVPTTLAGQAIEFPVNFLQSGVVLASGSGTVTGVVTNPTASLDHIDLGDSTSEAAHHMTASPTSGTGMEGGVSRRYSGSATDSSFSFDMAVPVGKPFVINAVETFDGPRVKEYTVKVNGVVVHNLHFQRTENSAGTGNYQILVDNPAAFSSSGTVSISMIHSPTAGYDPSVADVWTSAAH